MKYSVRGENVEVTEALNEFVKSRLDTLDKYFVVDDTTKANVLLSVERGGIEKVETTIPTKFGILRAEATEKDLYDAIDRVVDKLERQVRKLKTKFKKHRKEKEKLGLALDPAFLEAPEDLYLEEEEEIVRTKHITPEAKDVETAILEMEMLHHDFYIYRDIETENIHLIYKRKNGGYGVIETN
ncbi:ribosome hibernation-promoting factor, HPF/YfiA family [Mycoplasma sp. P36-A1]|uniref:ribosome hibernation-promoting factor, HPF/YfiA family n=1 Tax=Mycoplasma sp. P36-A1 TaxID=3252900 RepID=UPI003C2B83A8